VATAVRGVDAVRAYIDIDIVLVRVRTPVPSESLYATAEADCAALPMLV
jgi:hypothetical protein